MDLAASPTDAHRVASASSLPTSVRARRWRNELIVTAGGALTMYAIGATLASGPNSARVGGSNEHVQLALWLLLLVAGLVTSTFGALALHSYRGLRAELAAGITVVAAGFIAMAVGSPNSTDVRGGVYFALSWSILVAIAHLALAIAAKLHATAHRPHHS
ncbi:MAG: hypothetical protein AAGC46_00015 [Solirubrobacteraceae bacterium]|nr:hypothetical protein [Patulibacter sp.]